MEPLAIAAVAAALVLLAALVALERHHRADCERVRASRHREAEARHRAELELAELRVELEHSRHAHGLARLEVSGLTDRLEELEAAAAAKPLEGQHVAVTTPKADGERTFRGVCVRELEPRGLVLQAAELLEEDVERGQPIVRVRPAGDVVVPTYAWAQIVTPPDEEG